MSVRHTTGDLTDARTARGTARSALHSWADGLSQALCGTIPGARGHDGLRFTGFDRAYLSGPLGERRSWESLRAALFRCSA